MLSEEQHDAVVDCCLEAYNEVGYKFKGFEDLSLLNFITTSINLCSWTRRFWANSMAKNSKIPTSTGGPLTIIIGKC